MNRSYLAESIIFFILTGISIWYLIFSTAVLLFFGMEGADFIWYAGGWSVFIFSVYMCINSVKRWLNQ